MTEVLTETISWQHGRALRLLIRFSDNHSDAMLNGKTIFANPGEARPIEATARLDSLLKSGSNDFVFRGYNDPSAPQNPNPWRFDVYLQDNLGGRWEIYRDFSRTSAGYPKESAPLGLAYELKLKIEVT